uniref:Uncharacterized protein n=1 Tax=Romanomermis culicivorax TaxID=13658 RepID=A0A915IMU9_ROMCU
MTNTHFITLKGSLDGAGAVPPLANVGVFVTIPTTAQQKWPGSGPLDRLQLQSYGGMLYVTIQHPSPLGATKGPPDTVTNVEGLSGWRRSCPITGQCRCICDHPDHGSTKMRRVRDPEIGYINPTGRMLYVTIQQIQFKLPFLISIVSHDQRLKHAEMLKNYTGDYGYLK